MHTEPQAQQTELCGLGQPCTKISVSFRELLLCDEKTRVHYGSLDEKRLNGLFGVILESEDCGRGFPNSRHLETSSGVALKVLNPESQPGLVSLLALSRL